MTATPNETFYDLTLLVSGASDLSARAITNARAICDIHLEGRHNLSVVDVQEEKGHALSGELLAAPTLIRNSPLPQRKLIGDLSHTDKVLHGLGIPVGQPGA